MSQSSNIEWTDATWNPVRGCVKVSPGCANCYAETFAERFRGVKGHPYEQGFDLRLVPEKLAEPLSWKKPRRVFVNSMSDLFQDGVPDEYIDRVFAVMSLTPFHTYQILTKRPARMREYFAAPDTEWEDPKGRAWFGCGHSVETTADWLPIRTKYSEAQFHRMEDSPLPAVWPLPNVWLGTSVENQHFADERIPLLLQTPAAVRFISAEPLLWPVDMRPFVDPDQCDHIRQSCEDIGCCGMTKLDWVIVGGESGHGARPFDLAWARSIVQQCKAAGVPVFVKQLGSKPYIKFQVNGGTFTDPMCGETRLRSRKGGDIAEWPEDLRVREFPAEPVQRGVLR